MTLHSTELLDGIGPDATPDPKLRSAPKVRIEDRDIFPTESRATSRALAALSGIGIGATAGAVSGALDTSSGMIPALAGLAFIGGLLSTWSPCGYSSLSLLRPRGSYSARSIAGWTPTFLMHALGYAAGALLLGAMLGGAALMLPVSPDAGWVPIALGLLALGYGLHQLKFFSLPYPQRRAQVPHDARARFSLPMVGLLYGFSLGLNFLTYVRTPILYVTVAGALLSGSFTSAMILTAALNVGRFLPLIVNAFPVQDWTIQRWLAGTETRAVLADGFVLALAGSAFAAAALA
ncbi:methylamine utilization protein MauF [Indioceanicola profundi]|uniref:methylamine utilization protein MauF n=1 Tax=Indioceanicola profundi TaxID=2220096 RepID=UPI0013C52180|nr:methylamine utilization protein MauF [Indioceanicola profundi]